MESKSTPSKRQEKSRLKKLQDKSLSSDLLNVLIIGCGNIAGGLDSKKNKVGPPLSHAGSYSANPHFNIQACIDISAHRSKDFAKEWGIPEYYTSLDQAIRAGSCFDVISICSPTECHFTDIIACLALSPKLIFCEKPVTGTVADTMKVKVACEQAGVLLAINYNRRWDKHVINLKREIKANERGALRSVVGYYNKGILNNGSHLIDLLSFLIGDLVINHVGRPDYDFFENDPSIYVSLEAKNSVPVLLVPGAKAFDFSIFELQLIFEDSMLLMLDGGMRWVERRVNSSDVFDGYLTLNSGVSIKGGYLATMSNAVDNIWLALTKGHPLNSNVETALIAHSLCENIIKTSKH